MNQQEEKLMQAVGESLMKDSEEFTKKVLNFWLVSEFLGCKINKETNKCIIPYNLSKELYLGQEDFFNPGGFDLILNKCAENKLDLSLEYLPLKDIWETYIWLPKDEKDYLEEDKNKYTSLYKTLYRALRKREINKE